MATIKDVARETGLSVSTVSRVFNSRGYISEETKQKVYAAMKKLNYQPNEVARSLSKQSTNTIGVIVPHIRHPYFAELISYLESQARLNKQKILLFNSKEKNDKVKEYLEMCTSNRVSGIILCSGTVSMEDSIELDVPLITIERFLENGTAAIECDNLQGGRLAAKHLIELGCKNLIHFSGVHETIMPADSRAIGFRETCLANHVSFKEVATSELQYNNLEYHDFIENALNEYPETDGVFASSDLIAAQVIQVCAKKGIQIPNQLKLVGFDDAYIASLTTPRITTIHQPLKEMAQIAIELVISASKGKIVANRTTLPVSLVKRETT